MATHNDSTNQFAFFRRPKPLRTVPRPRREVFSPWWQGANVAECKRGTIPEIRMKGLSFHNAYCCTVQVVAVELFVYCEWLHVSESASWTTMYPLRPKCDCHDACGACVEEWEVVNQIQMLQGSLPHRLYTYNSTIGLSPA